MNKQHNTSGEQVWYIIGNIFTLGAWYFLKIIIKKALVEAHNSGVRDDARQS